MAMLHACMMAARNLYIASVQRLGAFDTAKVRI